METAKNNCSFISPSLALQQGAAEDLLRSF
jgi:hypothetical protein